MNDTDKIKWLLDNVADELSAWEQEFLDSNQHRRTLSEKQADILDRMWDKHYGDGD